MSLSWPRQHNSPLDADADARSLVWTAVNDRFGERHWRAVLERAEALANGRHRPVALPDVLRRQGRNRGRVRVGWEAQSPADLPTVSDVLSPFDDAATIAGIIASTQRSLELAVIGLNLCPFAKAVYVNRQIRYAVTAATTVEEFLAGLRHELELLGQAKPEEIETTLLIDPQVVSDFMLNRHSVPYLKKGRAGGSGAFRRAHWHTMRGLRCRGRVTRPPRRAPVSASPVAWIIPRYSRRYQPKRNWTAGMTGSG